MGLPVGERGGPRGSSPVSPERRALMHGIVCSGIFQSWKREKDESCPLGKESQAVHGQSPSASREAESLNSEENLRSPLKIRVGRPRSDLQLRPDIAYSECTFHLSRGRSYLKEAVVWP